MTAKTFVNLNYLGCKSNCMEGSFSNLLSENLEKVIFINSSHNSISARIISNFMLVAYIF